MDVLLELIEQHDYGQPDPGDTAGTLLAAASEGDATAAAQLSALAASHPDDARLYTEVLPAMPWDAVCTAVDADHHHAGEVVRAALGHVREDLSWGDAARIITWLYWITARAGEDDDLTLLEEALRTTLAWDAYWDQWTPRDQDGPQARLEVQADMRGISADRGLARSRSLPKPSVQPVPGRDQPRRVCGHPQPRQRLNGRLQGREPAAPDAAPVPVGPGRQF